MNTNKPANRVMAGLIIVLGGLSVVLLSFWITLTILNTRDKNLITLEDNIDRPEGDYREFELPTDAGPQVCQQECLKENRCHAFAYKRPAAKGENSRCWLKERVTEGIVANEYVSGVVRP